MSKHPGTGSIPVRAVESIKAVWRPAIGSAWPRLLPCRVRPYLLGRTPHRLVALGSAALASEILATPVFRVFF